MARRGQRVWSGERENDDTWRAGRDNGLGVLYVVETKREFAVTLLNSRRIWRMRVHWSSAIELG